MQTIVYGHLSISRAWIMRGLSLKCHPMYITLTVYKDSSVSNIRGQQHELPLWILFESLTLISLFCLGDQRSSQHIGATGLSLLEDVLQYQREAPQTPAHYTTRLTVNTVLTLYPWTRCLFHFQSLFFKFFFWAIFFKVFISLHPTGTWDFYFSSVF